MGVHHGAHAFLLEVHHRGLALGVNTSCNVAGQTPNRSAGGMRYTSTFSAPTGVALSSMRSTAFYRYRYAFGLRLACCHDAI